MNLIGFFLPSILSAGKTKKFLLQIEIITMLVTDVRDEMCYWQSSQSHQHHCGRNWNWILAFVCKEFGDEGYDAYRGVRSKILGQRIQWLDCEVVQPFNKSRWPRIFQKYLFEERMSRTMSKDKRMQCICLWWEKIHIKLNHEHYPSSNSFLSRTSRTWASPTKTCPQNSGSIKPYEIFERILLRYHCFTKHINISMELRKHLFIKQVNYHMISRNGGPISCRPDC